MTAIMTPRHLNHRRSSSTGEGPRSPRIGSPCRPVDHSDVRPVSTPRRFAPNPAANRIMRSDLGWLWIVAMGTLGGVGVLFLVVAYRMTKPSNLAPFDYFGILFAFVLGWIFFGEAPFDTLFPGVIRTGLVPPSSATTYMPSSPLEPSIGR